MTVADLIELLHLMPATATVTVAIRENVMPDGSQEALYEFREAEPDSVVYGHGRVLLQLDE